VQQWKKWVISFAALFLVVLGPITSVHASEKTVYDQFQKNSQQEQHSSPQTVESPSMGLSILQFIGSFLLIIGLLYFVLRFVSRRNKMLNTGGVFHTLGGHSLGNNRSVQLVMIGETLYILGVGDSIQVIRTIPPGEEQTMLLETVAREQAVAAEKWKGKWELFTQKTKQEKWNEILAKQLKNLKSAGSRNKDQS
jgi:flagellar protein FliO/FliZ